MTTANVSMGMHFKGVDLDANAAATVRGLRSAFADLALGFDPSLIYISPTMQAASGSLATPGLLQGASPLPLTGRKLLGGSSRRQLRDKTAEEEKQQAAAPKDGKVHWNDDAYAAYTRLSPSSVQMLTNALELNCGALQVGQKLPGERIEAVALVGWLGWSFGIVAGWLAG